MHKIKSINLFEAWSIHLCVAIIKFWLYSMHNDVQVQSDRGKEMQKCMLRVWQQPVLPALPKKTKDLTIYLYLNT